MQVRYHLLSEEEVAKLAEEEKNRLAKMQEESAKADQLAAQPLTDAEAGELIHALADRKTRRDAADTLSKKKHADGHIEEIARALDPLLADDDGGTRDAATKAYADLGHIGKCSRLGGRRENGR